MYIFLLIFFIFAVSYLNTYLNIKYKESFHSDKQSFILLGDSILKNNAYVNDGKSVEELLQEVTNGKTICLAKDNSKINNIYSQVDNIPQQLNNNFTTIFLSAGGNDILSHFPLEKENNVKNIDILDTIFDCYKKLIESIQIRIPNANLVLLDIYYPNNVKYNQYHSFISEWNKNLYSYSLIPKNNISSVLKVSNILTKPDDFSHGIEPSSIGSKKIVDSILTSY
jgi:hypothetical protein